MRSLRHPNIIRLEEVYETDDHLMLVMELAPGDELFDLILDRRKFNEEDGRRVFYQIAKALHYVHSRNILHRDVKPENVLVLKGSNLAVKLLDFGLSKDVGGYGSFAKTFVGTPCYLAPEVERAAHQRVKYGIEADCWSLGAVLYVMLVARFPEFRRVNGEIEVKLDPKIWGGVSEEAKDLIRSLMKYNSAERSTTAQALQHPWMADYKMSDDDLDDNTISYMSSLVDGGETVEYEGESSEEILPPPDDHLFYNHENEDGLGDGYEGDGNREGEDQWEELALVVHEGVDGVVGGVTNTPSGGRKGVVSNLNIVPMLQLQQSIASCMEATNQMIIHVPDLAASVRKVILLCRFQLVESTKLLRKVEGASDMVLKMFSDLMLAIEENVPELANEFFGMIKQQVSELKDPVEKTQIANRQTMVQIQSFIQSTSSNDSYTTDSIEQQSPIRKLIDNNLSSSFNNMEVSNSSDDNHFNQNNNGGISFNFDESELSSKMNEEEGESSYSPFPALKKHSPKASELEQKIQELHEQMQSDPTNVSHDDLLSLFAHLVPPVKSPEPEEETPISNNSNQSENEEDDNMKHWRGTSEEDGDIEDIYAEDEEISIIGGSDDNHSEDVVVESDEDDGSIKKLQQEHVDHPIPQLIEEDSSAFAIVPTTPKAIDPHMEELKVQLRIAFDCMHDVDHILEQMSVFWANTEVVLETLTDRGNYVEKFIGFLSNAKLRERFLERLREYQQFWEGLRRMSGSYIRGASSTQNRKYQFVEEVFSEPSLSSSSTASTARYNSQGPEMGNNNKNSPLPRELDVNRIDSS